MHSAIDWLCINDADAAILIPEVGKLIQTKWERVGYPFFVLSFLLNLALAVLMTFILVFVNATPTTSPGYVTEYLVNFLYAVVAMETFNFVVFGAQWFVLRGVARFDKAMRIIKSVSAYRGDHSPDYPDAPATVLYNKSDDAGIKVTLTICIITSWVHMYYYFMGFDKTGPFMLTMFRIIQTDVPFFFQFYSIVVFAFACALSMLSNNGDYRVTATHDNINEYFFFEPYLQWLADILLTGYYAIVNILMLNLLIAMISDTYSAYTSYNNAILLIAKYNIMHAMEKVMWDDELRDNRTID
ncbi:hypothetical protein B484DRAFT_402562 [Ochromonadaceae sp. CCMP2298]|nr:hypothetical protein B484DRAFT_402562 [Ochromonadaceae sp. CCMP2298]